MADKQVAELIDDLTTSSSRARAGPRRKDVAEYRHYFLGSIIISQKDGQKFIIDGQQRLTTLTLLLIYLQHCSRTQDDEVDIDELIFSEKYGKKSFNLDVDERTPAWRRCSTGQHFVADQRCRVRRRTSSPATTTSTSSFPDELADDALPYFVDWLIENVHLVEITAYSDDDAYTIFETMNDRGLSLTPADMLKGYLLANIDDGEPRAHGQRPVARPHREL